MTTGEHVATETAVPTSAEPTSAEPMTSGTVLELSSVPSAARLYATVARRTATAALSSSLPGRSGRRPALPNTTLVVRGVTPDVEQLTDYQHLFDDTAGDLLPPGFVHVQAFPLHVKLMTFDDFPFAPAGLVHVANRIEQTEPIGLGTPLDLRASVVGLREHPKGTAFDFITEVTPSRSGARGSGTAAAWWRGVSTYLARGKYLAGDSTAEPRPDDGNDTAEPAAELTGPPTDRPTDQPADRLGAGEPLPEYPTALWRLGGDTGRRYAAVSGDVNPIHLSWWTARPFGFHHAIAHGMYTAARALAAVPRRLDAPLRWEVSFGAPVYLPTTVAFALTHAQNTGAGAGPNAGPADAAADPARGVVWSPRSGRVHLRFSAGPL